jgi:Fe-S cluster assembly protein SufD
MAVVLDRAHSLIENHTALRELLGTYGPLQLQELRDRAMIAFTEAGIPTTKDEEFKYLPLHALEGTSYAPAYGATIDPADLEGLPLDGLDAITLTFINGEYAPELSNTSGLPQGARVMSLRDALEQHEGLVLRHLGKIASLEGRLGSTNDERFVHLNTAYLSEGAFIFVSKGVSVETPIHLKFVNRADHGAFASHPRILIVLEEAAQAKVVETHQSIQGSDAKYFANVVDEIHLGANAFLEHVKFQDESPSAIHIANIYAHQESASTYTSTNVAFGGAIARTDLNAYVGGEHCETWLNGAYLGRDEQIIDSHTRIDHALPNCHSFEVYKGILDGRSTGVFNGKIFVYEDAQKTDAKQTNQALLLSPTATINTKPQLEIFADDVKCTHGATVGQIREDALFYLRSRAIPEADARKLLVYAFVAEVLERVTVEAVRSDLEKALFDRVG